MATTNVYVLRCANGKRYIGKATNIEQRLEQHFNSSGSAWTRKHEPIEVEKVYRNVSAFDEDKITKEQMAKHGIENVRGGTYSSVHLTSAQKEGLEQEIAGAEDRCFTCRGSGHFANDCTKEEGDEEEDDDDEDDEDDEDDDDEEEDEEEDADDEEDEDEGDDCGYYSD